MRTLVAHLTALKPAKLLLDHADGGERLWSGANCATRVHRADAANGSGQCVRRGSIG